MDASPPLLPAAHTKEQRQHALGSPVNAGTQMLQRLLLLALKDNAQTIQLQLQMAPAIPSGLLAELKEQDASMLPNHVPPTLVLNRNVMPSEERTEHKDAGTLQLPLLHLLVLLNNALTTLLLLLILNARPS